MPDWNWQKIRQKLSSTLSLNFRFLKTICYLYPRYHPETIDDILKNAHTKTATVLITLYDKWQWKWSWKGKIDHMDELKRKNRSHGCDTNRPRPRHKHKYTKYKMCLNIMMVICIK